MDYLLNVKDLTTYFYHKDTIIRAVNGISFSLGEGETLAILGESGCGKTVSMLSIMGILRPPGRVVRGSACFMGKDLLTMKHEELRQICGKEIALVPQDPKLALNPTMTIGSQLMETMFWHGYKDKDMIRERCIEVLDKVGLPSPKERMRDYPFQFSGGMLQRVLIAMAILCEPSLIIADEPTTGLDVTVQAQIIDLLDAMRESFETSIIFVTHDVGAAARLCQRIQIMYAGKLVEVSSTLDFLHRPLHPYSKGLLDSAPYLVEKPKPIKGAPPNPWAFPNGCSFYPRCPLSVAPCKKSEPILKDLGNERFVACHLF